jgi:Protein of unknown function (DUF2384)
MELRSERHAAEPTLLGLSPEQRADPAIRRRLTGPAMRAFFHIAQLWQLSVHDQRALLGWPAPSTFHKYKAGEYGTLSHDALIRISLVLGIYKALQLLYPDATLADVWVRLPNTNPMFDGSSPLKLMTENGIDGLLQVRRLLDARRG